MTEDSMQDISATEPADLVEALWSSRRETPDLKRLLAEHPAWSARELRDALLLDQHRPRRDGRHLTGMAPEIEAHRGLESPGWRSLGD